MPEPGVAFQIGAQHGQAVKAPEKLAINLEGGHTKHAARGVFGVPAFEVDGKLFWGFDSLAMLRAYLEGDTWFGHDWDAAASVAQGLPG